MKKINTAKHNTFTWSLPSCIRPFHDAVNLRLSTEQLITLQGKHIYSKSQRHITTENKIQNKANVFLVCTISWITLKKNTL